jgi:hypothetical protein
MSQTLNGALNISDERAKELAEKCMSIVQDNSDLDKALTKIYADITGKDEVSVEEKEAIFAIFGVAHFMINKM